MSLPITSCSGRLCCVVLCNVAGPPSALAGKLARCQLACTHTTQPPTQRLLLILWRERVRSGENQIKKVKQRLARERELDGIDTSNIIDEAEVGTYLPDITPHLRFTEHHQGLPHHPLPAQPDPL